MATNNEVTYLGQNGTEQLVATVKILLSSKQDKGEYISASNIDQIAMLIESDMLPAVYNVDGKILTDKNNNVILRY